MCVLVNLLILIGESIHTYSCEFRYKEVIMSYVKWPLGLSPTL